MGYVLEVLGRWRKSEGEQRKGRQKRFVDSVSCGYCHGSGSDPRYAGSICPVCGGDGKIEVTAPVVTCIKCRGSGRENGNLTCLACRGTGVVQVPEDADTCPKCKGTGKDGVFYCLTCKGQGIA